MGNYYLGNSPYTPRNLAPVSVFSSAASDSTGCHNADQHFDITNHITKRSERHARHCKPLSTPSSLAVHSAHVETPPFDFNAWPTPMTFGATCMARPESFPDAGEGTAWGDQALTIDLPGGPYVFLGLETNQASLVRRVLAHRAKEGSGLESGDGAVVTQIRRAARPDFLDFERVDWKILIDVDYRPQGLRLAAHQWLGRLSWGEGFSGILWTPVTEGSAFTDLFENYFRILVAYRLLATGGLLVHSAGVVDGGDGFVFPGASGNGKSTLSKISRREGRLVLSDDGNALGLERDATGRSRVWIEALPFGGEMREQAKPRGRFPLRRITALRKGPDNHLEAMSKAAATGLLLGCSPFVNGDPHQTSRLLETIDALLAHVPASTLTFNKAGGFWDLLRHATGAPS